MTVVLQLDKYSAETAWSIDSLDGSSNFAARPVGYYEEMKSQWIEETVRLPEGLEYQFKIEDYMGERRRSIAFDLVDSVQFLTDLFTVILWTQVTEPAAGQVRETYRVHRWSSNMTLSRPLRD